MFFYSIQLKRKIYTLFFVGIILSLVAFFLKEIYIPDYAFRNVKADLVIPKENTFLKRPGIISQIEEKGEKGLADGNRIDVIVLVGEQGSGKTVLARYYGYEQHDKIVWEFNAENKETLSHSFKDFAYSLAATNIEKEELLKIENIEDLEAQDLSFLSFIRKILKNHKNWVLIYDNVKNFSEIENYLPQDTALWGTGKVLLVTRDENLKDFKYIKHENIIKVGELQKEEALTLFSTILFDFSPNILDLEKKQETIEFLSQIRHFPLDITMAARYIKNGKVSYKKYLELLSQNDPDFQRLLDIFIKEGNDY